MSFTHCSVCGVAWTAHMTACAATPTYRVLNGELYHVVPGPLPDFRESWTLSSSRAEAVATALRAPRPHS